MLKNNEAILTVLCLVGKIVGRTKLQKMMYLLQTEQKLPINLDFQIYLYGPFSRGLNNEVDKMISDGLIENTQTITNLGGVCYEYTISDKGRKTAMNILEKLPRDIKEKIITNISKFGSMTATDIVRYVYENYPDAKPRQS
ncbi:MAG: hypothetical protein KKC75_00390 [Nanoarchaeota archaeon]|nr:hypothetical protein [Nanoarchaeota archaeon]MBU1004976.1 hypothetical protein [Nanoarchaeota archaeon]MBU1946257.1 hypothetical protein [Nanoarchaeota archaeon]